MDKYVKDSDIYDIVMSQFCASSDETEAALNAIIEGTRALPPADVRPARYGKWEKHGWSIRCSECGYDMPFATRNFCPNCGADCRGDKDGE